MRILAIDPGKTTGLARWSDGVGERGFFAWSEPYDDALSGVMYDLTNVDGGTPPDLIVMEDFVISQRTIKTSTAGWRRGMELEFIGAVRWACSTSDTEFLLQTPERAKSFSTDDKLRKMGWWTKGLDHPRDATRHLLLAMTVLGLIEPERLVSDE